MAEILSNFNLMDKDLAVQNNVNTIEENPNIWNIKKILHLKKHWKSLNIIHSPFQEAHTKLFRKYRKL